MKIVITPKKRIIPKKIPPITKALIKDFFSFMELKDKIIVPK